MQFHEKLCGLRKQAGMTQSDLAEKLNVSRQAVSRWEMGTAKPEVDTLIAMGDLFDVSLDYLLRDKMERQETEPAEPSPPRYLDFVPRLWWLPAVIAVFFKAAVYLAGFMQLYFPGIIQKLTERLNEQRNVLVMILFSLQGWNLFSTVFFALTAFCFFWALVKWLKARR